MPIRADAARPIRTVDVRGNTISTANGAAPPIKTVDTAGREVQAMATEVASQAVAANPDLPKEAAKAEDGAEPAKTDGEHKPSDAEIRKAYIEAQRARRRAVEMEKRARDGLTRAEAFEKARQMAESGEDPTAILKAAGIDHVKYYQNLTKYALSDKAKQDEDPKEREIREHKAKVDEYAKKTAELEKRIQEREDNEVHNQVIREKVIPLLQQNPDKYEALIAEYGQNAAIEVYKTVWDIYQETGKVRGFTEVADEMETYWSETIGKGIEAAAKLKKFRGRFAQAAPEAGNPKVDATETPRPTVTLSNRPSAASPPAAPTQSRRRLTKEERIAEILKRFPD